MRSLTIVFAFFLFTNVPAGDNDLFLKNIRWGMDQAQLKVSKTGTDFVSYNTGRMQYDTEINGMNFTVGYEFRGGRLHRVFYGLNDKFNDGDRYREVYLALKDHLMIKYGQPVSEQDSLKPGAPSYRSLALTAEHREYRCQWKAGNTNVELFCGMDKGEFKTVVIYDKRSS
jgi:hypothetical protein